jgi:hypothetical protein
MRTKLLLTSLRNAIFAAIRKMFGSNVSTIVFIILLSFNFCLLSSQIPQGFNYQAIVRNASGNVLLDKSLKVTVAIKTALSGGTVLWEEYHSVTSNYLGLVSFAVGSGTRVTGSITSFKLIPWEAQPLYLNTKVEYPVGTTTDMGAAQILSVPYSLVAKDVQGPLTKLDIKGTESSFDSTLFEVKNKNGQTIFAVYNEGVRIWVDNGAKGAKGGFAVGGFDMAKNTKQTFLAVSDDSVKIYIDSDPLTKKPKGGFAVGGYDMAKDGIITQNYLDVTPATTKVFTADTIKGFAVGNVSTGVAENYLKLNPLNYFIGHQAGKAITTGLYNSVVGYQSGYSINTGTANSFIGYKTGYSDSTGNYNVFLGNETGYKNNGSYNTFIGFSSGRNNTSGSYNCFIGDSSGYSNTLGTGNTFMGGRAGYTNSTGGYNTFLGSKAGYNNFSGTSNTFLGNKAGWTNSTGMNNVFVGSLAGYSNSDGSSNAFFGKYAGNNNTSGYNNTLLGFQTGLANRNGYDITIIGVNGNVAFDYLYNSTAIGYGAIVSASNNFVMGNSSVVGWGFGVAPGAAAIRVGNSTSNGNGATLTLSGVWTDASDNSKKYDIENINYGLNEVMKLRPVTYKLKGSDNQDIGFIAQDVKKIIPEIVYGEEGEMTLSYGQITSVLTKAIQQQQQQIESYKSENDNLKSQLQSLQEKVEQIEAFLAKSGGN